MWISCGEGPSPLDEGIEEDERDDPGGDAPRETGLGPVEAPRRRREREPSEEEPAGIRRAGGHCDDTHPNDTQSQRRRRGPALIRVAEQEHRDEPANHQNQKPERALGLPPPRPVKPLVGRRHGRDVSRRSGRGRGSRYTSPRGLRRLELLDPGGVGVSPLAQILFSSGVVARAVFSTAFASDWRSRESSS